MPALKALDYIYKEEGLRGVYSGFYIRSSKLIPGLVIYLTAYEHFKNILNRI
jgi:hypothetical protein